MKQNIKTENKICPHCNKEFLNINSRVFANHVRWCEKNPRHEELSGKKFSEKMSKVNNNVMDRKYGKIVPHIVKCSNKKCGKEFYVFEREKKFPEKEHYFCCKQCASSYSSSFTDHNKIRESRLKFDREHPGFWAKDKKPTIKYITNCLWCGKEFETNDRINSKCCCRSCASRYMQFKDFSDRLNICVEDYDKVKMKLQYYRQLCKFDFSLNSFPDEFDFELIEKYGWYSASNHGGNIYGVSRDHMYSVKEGFLNKIDPRTISHPANCRLIRQSENSSKREGCFITLDELMEKISQWNEKYGLYESKTIYTEEQLKMIFD